MLLCFTFVFMGRVPLDRMNYFSNSCMGEGGRGWGNSPSTSKIQKFSWHSVRHYSPNFETSPASLDTGRANRGSLDALMQSFDSFLFCFVNSKDVPLQQASILLQPPTGFRNDSLTMQPYTNWVQTCTVFSLLFTLYLATKSTFIFTCLCNHYLFNNAVNVYLFTGLSNAIINIYFTVNTTTH